MMRITELDFFLLALVSESKTISATFHNTLGVFIRPQHTPDDCISTLPRPRKKSSSVKHLLPMIWLAAVIFRAKVKFTFDLKTTRASGWSINQHFLHKVHTSAATCRPAQRYPWQSLQPWPFAASGELPYWGQDLSRAGQRKESAESYCELLNIPHKWHNPQ